MFSSPQFWTFYENIVLHCCVLSKKKTYVLYARVVLLGGILIMICRLLETIVNHSVHFSGFLIAVCTPPPPPTAIRSRATRLTLIGFVTYFHSGSH